MLFHVRVYCDAMSRHVRLEYRMSWYAMLWHGMSCCMSCCAMYVAFLSFCSHFAIGGMSPELDSFRALGLRLLVQLIIAKRWQRHEVLLGLGNWRRPPRGAGHLGRPMAFLCFFLSFFLGVGSCVFLPLPHPALPFSMECPDP